MSSKNQTRPTRGAPNCHVTATATTNSGHQRLSHETIDCSSVARGGPAHQLRQECSGRAAAAREIRGFGDGTLDALPAVGDHDARPGTRAPPPALAHHLRFVGLVPADGVRHRVRLTAPGLPPIYIDRRRALW